MCPSLLQLTFVIFSAVSHFSNGTIVGIVLSWALSGEEIQRWQKVPLDSFLEDVVTEDMLEALPGQVEVLIGQRRLQRPLHIEVRQCMKSSEDVLLIGLVRTHVMPRKNKSIRTCLQHVCVIWRIFHFVRVCFAWCRKSCKLIDSRLAHVQQR